MKFTWHELSCNGILNIHVNTDMNNNYGKEECKILTLFVWVKALVAVATDFMMVCRFSSITVDDELSSVFWGRRKWGAKIIRDPVAGVNGIAIRSLG